MPRVLEVIGYWILKSPLEQDRHGGRLLIPRRDSGGWTFNGDFERPTFTPSVLQTWDVPSAVEGEPPSRQERNHYFVTDGQLQFLSDSTHELAGLTVDCLEFTPDEIVRWSD